MAKANWETQEKINYAGWKIVEWMAEESNILLGDECVLCGTYKSRSSVPHFPHCLHLGAVWLLEHMKESYEEWKEKYSDDEPPRYPAVHRGTIPRKRSWHLQDEDTLD